MSKIIFLSFLCIILCQCLWAQADTAHPSTAKIYFIRQTGNVEAILNMRVLANDSIVCKISNKRFCVHNFAPGSYTFNAVTWDNPKNEKYSTELLVEAGKTYYLRLATKTTFWRSFFYCQDITYNSAKPLLDKFKPEKDCVKRTFKN